MEIYFENEEYDDTKSNTTINCNNHNNNNA